MSLLDLQRTAGNAAVTARLEQLADTVPTPRVDPHLPRGLSAYTVNGEIHVNPRVALLPGPEVSRILRHEAVHSAHQRLWAPLNRTDEGEQARSRAERAAVDGERGFRAWTHLLRPAPSVLAYPGTDYGPWPTVWVGKAGVIAQMQVGDVTIRLFRSYSRLKITKAPQDKTFECGDHARAPIPTLAARMTAVAQQVVDVNAKIPKGAPERVTMVLAPESDEPGYRLLNGTGAIVLDTANFNPESAAHEASHALFELHSGRSAASPRPPTRLALAVAELFSALRSTKNVPIPTRAFDAKKGRPGRTDRKRLSPAGVVMVSDTLWAGRGGTPGTARTSSSPAPWVPIYARKPCWDRSSTTTRRRIR